MIRRVMVPDAPVLAQAVEQLFVQCGVDSNSVWASDTFVLRHYAPMECTCRHATEEQRWMEQHRHHPTCGVHLLAVGYDDNVSYCTCGHDEALEQWRATHPHDLTCCSGPNFYFAPRSYALWWYDRPLLGAWATHPLTEREFLRIFRQCLETL